MKSFTGTWRLVRLAIRRDRITVPLTLLIVVAMVGGGAPALVESYPDAETQVSYVASSAPSVVGRLFQGTVQDVSLGTIIMAETYLFTAVILGIMSIMIVTRHTRHNEEIGAGELIGSAIVGRNAPLGAAMIWAIITNIIAAALVLIFIAPVAEIDAVGSAYMAASLAAVGIFFASVAAITAQLSDYRRGANSLGIGILFAFFLIRGLGDAVGELGADGVSVTASWITWMSPIGWGYQVLPYTENRLLPMALIVLLTTLCVGLAFSLRQKRDLGSGLFQSKPGLARAKPVLLSASGLARRLQRTGFYGWLAGFAVAGVMIGVITNDFQETFQDAEVFQNLLASGGSTGSITDAIFAAMIPLMTAMLSGFVVSSATKMSDEETSGRIEYLLGTAVGRTRWFMSHALLIIGGVVALLVTLGFTAAASYTLTVETQDTSFIDILSAGVASIPAMTLMLAIILVIYGLFGRFIKAFAWALYGYVALIGTFVSMFGWPEWVSYLSPFHHVPAVPSSSVDFQPLLIMSVLTIGLLAIVNLLFADRDLALK